MAEVRYSGASDTLRWREGPYIPMGRESELWFEACVSGETGEDTLYLDQVQFRAWALDRNYHDYFIMRWGGQQAGHELLHLEGAVGVFGAACIAETTLCFTPPRAEAHRWQRAQTPVVPLPSLPVSRWLTGPGSGISSDSI
jgi:hypothetical protein